MDPLAQLFERFRARGDLRALGRVFDELAPRLLPLVLHLCDAADAEDVLQQTFLLAIERADTFDATRRLEPWLAGLLTNIANNARRSARRRRAEAMPEVAATEEGPADAAERAELIAHLRTHVDALPHEQRQVLLLQLQHGMTPAEIAEVLAEAPGTVRMRIHRGLQALRRLLPAGLSALLLGALPTRGLAAVRAAVLRSGAARTATTAAATAAATTVLGGLVAMKKILAAFALLLCCGILWWTLTPPTLPADRSAGTNGVTPAAANAGAASSPHDATPDVAAAEPSQRTVATGALRIRVVAATDDGRELPQPGTLLSAWSGDSALEPFDDSALQLRTDDHGEVLLPTLLPGPWRVLVPAHKDEPRAATVAPGAEALVEYRLPARTVIDGIVVD